LAVRLPPQVSRLCLFWRLEWPHFRIRRRHDAELSGAGSADGPLGGAIVGQPLVFTGIVTTKQGSTTSVADIFVVTSNAVNTWLEHWKYTETDGSSGVLAAISDLPLVVGGTAVVSRPNLPVLNLNTKISQ